MWSDFFCLNSYRLQSWAHLYEYKAGVTQNNYADMCPWLKCNTQKTHHWKAHFKIQLTLLIICFCIQTINLSKDSTSHQKPSVTHMHLKQLSFAVVAAIVETTHLSSFAAAALCLRPLAFLDGKIIIIMLGWSIVRQRHNWIAEVGLADSIEKASWLLQWTCIHRSFVLVDNS